MDYLSNLNPHPKDKTLTFDEPSHVYTITRVDNNGNEYEDSGFTSVTTWNHSHFEGFDADKIIAKMMASRNWSNSKYYGMTPEEIKGGWEENRNNAANAGTKMHNDIERFYNKLDVDNDSIEYKWFLDFEKERDIDLTPYRTEWMVYDEDVRIVGSIDMIFEKPDGTLVIYDWKRSKEIKKTNPWKSSHVSCISHLPDSNFWHYALQLNTYKTIIEKKYGKTVSGMYLVCLHPDNYNKSYQRIEVPELRKELTDLFDLRKEQI